MFETPVHVSATVVTDPILRTGSTGVSFLTFRVAVNSRRWTKDKGWIDADSDFFSVVAFRHLANNSYRSLSKGQAVIVSGRLRTNRYETKDGEVRTSVQIEAYDIGPSLKFGHTSFVKCTQPKMPSNDKLAEQTVAETLELVETGSEAELQAIDEGLSNDDDVAVAS